MPSVAKLWGIRLLSCIRVLRRGGEPQLIGHRKNEPRPSNYPVLRPRHPLLLPSKGTRRVLEYVQLPVEVLAWSWSMLCRC